MIETEEWTSLKDAALASMSEPDFWESDTRARTLGDYEYMDRIQMGLDTAGSLIARLGGAGANKREYYSPDLVARLSHQLYLLEAACDAYIEGSPRDAFLSIEGGMDARGDDPEAVRGFVDELAAMYLGWAEKRRMKLDLNEIIRNGDNTSSVLLAVSGFGSYRLLEPERGLHVLEMPRDGSSFSRIRARVRVAGQPFDVVTSQVALREVAIRHLRESEETGPVVVRRYRREPSPLVRDAVRGWRTGNIEQVLSGDFDLMVA